MAQPGAVSAYESIRVAIVEGRYRPGDRLIEQRVAEELALSRTPVREAFRMLQTERLVDVEPNRGARVRNLTAADINDVYELRARLEAMAGELAAERATDVERAALEEAAARFAEAAARAQGGDVRKVRAVFVANQAFHRTVLDAAHSERLQQALATTADDTLVFQAFRHYQASNLERSVLFHSLITEAVTLGESARAGRLVYEHVLQGRDRLLVVVADAGTVDGLYDS